MDPVSLGVSIVTLVHLAVKAISLASSYVASAKDAKSSISRLVVELEALKSNLSGLQTLLDGNPARFHQSSAISACSATCKTVLDNLCRRLENAGDGDSLWILWPLKEKEHEKTIRDIRALVSYIHLALTIDGSWLLSRSLDDVLAVLDQMNELKSLKRLVESTNDLADSLITHDTLAKQKQDLDCRNKVFEWLSVTNYSHRHNTIVAGRVEGTGCWLLETPQFRSWIAGGMAPNLLWCHGIHGSGKTVLA